MNITEIGYIKEAVRILNNGGLTKLEINDGDKKITLERSGEVTVSSPSVSAPVTESAALAPEADAVDLNDVYEIKSPLVGVFYASPSPEDEPFVRMGGEVKKGDVLCIVEAMKLMNEIIAERDGKIVDICLKNGDVAEYGQVLFKLI